MIKLEQFLTEGRDAPLYHGTRVGVLHSIITDGIKNDTEQQKWKLLKEKPPEDIMVFTKRTLSGVSLTRSLPFAKSFGFGLVLVMDQRLLSQRYEIKPLQYWRNSLNTGARSQGATIKNEFEEFVITNKPIPFKFVKKIMVKTSRSDDVGKILESLKKQYGDSFVEYYND